MNVATARWVECDDAKKLEEFKRKSQASLALDGGDNLSYIATDYGEFEPSFWTVFPPSSVPSDAQALSSALYSVKQNVYCSAIGVFLFVSFEVRGLR